MSASHYREFLSTAVAPGIRLFALPTDRFKTVRVRVFLCDALRPVDATRNSLLAYVLRAGSQQYPSRRDLARACEDLYGASVSVGVTRFGDVQALAASAEFPADRFLPKGSDELHGVLDLLSGMILRPALEPAGTASTLRAETVTQEKDQLRNELQGMRDEKPAWAAWLASQRIYAGTPGAIAEQGRIEDLPAIDGPALLARHQLLLRNARMFAFVTGPVDPEKGLAALAKHLALPRGKRQTLPLAKPLAARKTVSRGRVREKTEQTHLISAWSGAPLYGTPAFAPMLFADGIFGGFSFSRLFKIVRETHGLAYAVSSHFGRSRGVMIAQAAVDPGKADQAAKLIRSEFARLAKGGFTAEEFSACRDSLIEARRSAWDSPSARVMDCMLQATMGFKQTPEQQLKAIRAVKPAQVLAVLKKLKPHTEFRYGT